MRCAATCCRDIRWSIFLLRLRFCSPGCWFPLPSRCGSSAGGSWACPLASALSAATKVVDLSRHDSLLVSAYMSEGGRNSAASPKETGHETYPSSCVVRSFLPWRRGQGRRTGASGGGECAVRVHRGRQAAPGGHLHDKLPIVGPSRDPERR